jgi:hypothetical protein
MSSSVGLNPNPTQVQPDDNLVNGQTYTFVFASGNWFSTPATATIQNDVTAGAPNFLTQVVVQYLSPNFYVTFTYEGDGSDVALDVANSITAAVAATSGDVVSYTGGQQGPVVINTPLPATPGTGLTLGNLLTPVTATQQQAQTVAEQQQVQQVAQNAAIIAPGSPSAAAAQTAATQQLTQAGADQSSVATTANAGSVGNLLAGLGNLNNSTVLLVLAVVAAAVVWYVVKAGGVQRARAQVGV